MTYPEPATFKLATLPIGHRPDMALIVSLGYTMARLFIQRVWLFCHSNHVYIERAASEGQKDP